MTEENKNLPPTKKEVQSLGNFLTLQNVAQIVVILFAIAAFYYNTSYRLTAAEETLKSTNKILHYQQEWLIGLSMKTGVPPPARREE